MPRTAVLIDNMYLQHVALAYGLGDLDVRLFSLSLLEKDEELFRTYVFDALPYLPPNPSPEQVQRRDNKYQYLDCLKYLDRVTVELGYVKPKSTICRECKKLIKSCPEKREIQKGQLVACQLKKTIT